MYKYLQAVKAIADELASIDAPIFDDNLVIHILNGIGRNFKELAVAVRGHDIPISFKDFNDKTY